MSPLFCLSFLKRWNTSYATNSATGTNMQTSKPSGFCANRTTWPITPIRFSVHTPIRLASGTAMRSSMLLLSPCVLNERLPSSSVIMLFTRCVTTLVPLPAGSKKDITSPSFTSLASISGYHLPETRYDNRKP